MTSRIERTLPALAEDLQRWVPTNEMLRRIGFPLTFYEVQRVIAIVNKAPEILAQRDAILLVSAQLEGALMDALPYVDGFMRLQDERGNCPKDTYDIAARVAERGRAALSKAKG